MAKARLSMRKIKEVLRLKYHGALSRRQIAEICQISRTTVADYLYRAEKAGIGWPLPQDLTDGELEQRLFPAQTGAPLAAKPLPDFDYVYQELKAHKKFNLTLDLLWREYKEQYPDGYQYSQFCLLYRSWQKKLDYCMRQDHRGGEKLFVDYGEGLSLVDPKTGRADIDSAFCRRVGRFELHLCRSHPYSTAARLDRLSRQSFFLLWLCSQGRGAGLS